jgi:hypothetical protein
MAPLPRCQNCGHLEDDHVEQADRRYACEVVHGENQCGCPAFVRPRRH